MTGNHFNGFRTLAIPIKHPLCEGRFRKPLKWFVRYDPLDPNLKVGENERLSFHIVSRVKCQYGTDYLLAACGCLREFTV